MKFLKERIKNEKKEFSNTENKLKECLKNNSSKAKKLLGELRQILSRLKKIEDKKELKKFQKKIKEYQKKIQDSKKPKKKKKDKVSRKARKRRFNEFIQKAGIDISFDYLMQIIFKTSLILTFILSAGLLIYGSVFEMFPATFLVVATIVMWTLGFFFIFALIWIIMFLIVDLKIYKRKVEMEEVLADFLQLTSGNIRAGMPIDKALWYAVRPKFGVLAKEIEMVAKETMSGKDLKDALKIFSKKYDSEVLKRTVNLLIEGIEAGGEIGDLLNRIAIDIQESKTMKKEMAASIMTYVIFIGFATIAAAPLLFALSKQLILVVGKVSGSFSMDSIPTGMGIGFSGAGITASDFQLFALISLSISSIFSGMIIAMIQKGNIKSGLKYIPMFIVATVLIFFGFNMVLGHVLGFFF